MKKFYKIWVFVLMFALAIGGALVAPITIFATGPALVGASIVLTKMPTTAKVNTTVTIPAGDSASTVVVTVLDPYGNPVETTLSGANRTFQAKIVGDYKVSYTATNADGVKTQSEVYIIKVTGEKAVLDFTENSPFIMQSKVGANSTLVLPYPEVSITGEKDDFVAGHYTGEGATDANITVTVSDPAHNTWAETTSIQDYTNPLGKTTIDGKTYYTFKPAQKTAEGTQSVVYGTYAVYFKFVNADTNVVVTKAQKIQVSENYSTDNQKVTFTWNGSLPESAVLGKEVELPKPITVDENKSKESVQTYTTVDVVYHNGTEEKKYDVEDFKFRPMDEAKSGSYYTLTYKIYTLEQLNLAGFIGSAEAANKTLAKALEAADATGKVLTRTYRLSNVTDTEAPKAKAVGAYAVEDNGTLSNTTKAILEDEDTSYAIPSKARTQVEIEIPAAYAIDNYSEYEDLTLSRTLIDEDNNSYSLDGESELNATDIEKTYVKQAKVNENAKVTFRMKGTYTIKYKVTDKANNSSEVSYKIVVTDTLVDDLAPYIVMPTIPGTIKPTETLSFAQPTVADYKDDHTAGSTTSTKIDENVKKDVYYYYGQANDLTDFDAMLAASQLTKLNAENEKYSIEIPENPASNYLTIVVRAEDDAKYSTGRTANNVGYKYKVVSIYHVNDDVAPVLETTLMDIATSLNDVYGQNETINFATPIEFTDDDNNGDATRNMVASLKVYDKNDNEINVSGVKYVYDGTKFSLQGGKFTTTVAGAYRVVVTATDLGGNSLVCAYQFEVKDTKAPAIELDSIETTMELGKTYTLPTPVIVDDGEVIENYAYSQVEFGDDCPSYLFNQGTLEFTPKEKGTYTFRYLAEDEHHNISYSNYYTISVSDTQKPVLVINETEEYSVPETAQYKDANNQVVNVKLPLFTATDEYNGIKSTSITVKDPDGDELTVNTVVDHYEFTPNKNGVYTVTYQAVDYAGNTTTETYSISVGDVTAPTLSGTVAPHSYKIGETLKVDLSQLSLTDDTDATRTGSSAVNSSNLTVTLTGPDGSVELTKADDIYSYKFEKAGTYTLKYAVKDDAGNTDDLTYTFEVKGNSASTSISEKAWGIGLIVLSVVILGGVVVYFVKTKDAPAEKAEKKGKEEK